jgi:Fe-S-cluster containining protein
MLDPFSISVVTIVSVSIASGVVAMLLPYKVREYRLGKLRDKFECVCCGNCCRFRVTPLKRKDVERLEKAGYTGFHRHVKGELSMRRVNGRCIFLRDDKCTVYEHRPQVCRDFPFYRLFGVWFCTDTAVCPGVERLKEMV